MGRKKTSSKKTEEAALSTSVKHTSPKISPAKTTRFVKETQRSEKENLEELNNNRSFHGKDQPHGTKKDMIQRNRQGEKKTTTKNKEEAMNGGVERSLDKVRRGPILKVTLNRLKEDDGIVSQEKRTLKNERTELCKTSQHNIKVKDEYFEFKENEEISSDIKVEYVENDELGSDIKVEYVENDEFASGVMMENEGTSDLFDEEGEMESIPPPAVILGSQGLVNSEQDENEMEPLKCEVCGELFCGRYYLRKHYLMVHENKTYKCSLCSFESFDKKKVNEHISRVHLKHKSKVDQITARTTLEREEGYMLADNIPRKIIAEDGVCIGTDSVRQRYACDVCDRVCGSPYSLKRHFRKHSREKPYMCLACPHISSYDIRGHIRSHHLIVDVNADEPQAKEGDEKIPLEDPPCKKKIGGERKRNYTLRHKCAVCGMKSSHKSELVDHITELHPNAHIGLSKKGDDSEVPLNTGLPSKVKEISILRIKCEYCSRVFHDNWKYKVHLRTHTGVKPYRCSECETRATSKDTIRDHVYRKHPEVKDPKILLKTSNIDGSFNEVELPFPWKEWKCSFCNKVFKDNYELKTHREKDHMAFMCIACEYRAKSQALMLLHCAKKHKKEPAENLIRRNGKPISLKNAELLTCHTCDKVFMYQSQLKYHVATHLDKKSSG